MPAVSARWRPKAARWHINRIMIGFLGRGLRLLAEAAREAFMASCLPAWRGGRSAVDTKVAGQATAALVAAQAQASVWKAGGARGPQLGGWSWRRNVAVLDVTGPSRTNARLPHISAGGRGRSATAEIRQASQPGIWALPCCLPSAVFSVVQMMGRLPSGKRYCESSRGGSSAALARAG